METNGTQNRRRAGISMLIVLDVLLLAMVLAIAVHTIVVSRLKALKPAVQSQLDFWQKRSDELCMDPAQRPVPPILSTGSDPLDQLNSLSRLNAYSKQVWEKYESCQEPVSLEIHEDLLHFKFNRFDEYEGNAEPGFARIRGYVDQYINTHTQVYILGHTDDVVKPENETYNNELSYRRALEVSQVVERHLASLGKHRGTDYQLFTIGMGKAQLLTRDAKEDLDHWRTNCRRIELQFRSLSPAKKLTE